MTTKPVVDQSKADAIRLEELEAAELEGSVEASVEEYELYLDIKNIEAKIAEDLVRLKAARELLKEHQMKAKISHLTHHGVELTTLSKSERKNIDTKRLSSDLGEDLLAEYINTTTSYSLKVK